MSVKGDMGMRGLAQPRWGVTGSPRGLLCHDNFPLQDLALTDDGRALLRTTFI